jgi:hypothetical protein
MCICDQRGANASFVNGEFQLNQIGYGALGSFDRFVPGSIGAAELVAEV